MKPGTRVMIVATGQHGTVRARVSHGSYLHAHRVRINNGEIVWVFGDDGLVPSIVLPFMPVDPPSERRPTQERAHA